MTIDKDKLFIELYHEWEKDKSGWFLTKMQIEYLEKANQKNIEVMGEVELINKYLLPYPGGKMTNTDIQLKLQNLHPSFKTNSKRMGQALKKCGYEQTIIRESTKIIRAYEVKFNESVTYQNYDYQQVN